MRYHIIIPSDDNLNRPDDNLNRPLKGDFLANRNHLLHGLIHYNGYGHLLSINNSINNSDDDDSNLLDLWDRLCTTLQISEYGAHEWVRGSGLDLDIRLRYEVGPDDGKMDCVCGTKRDDGGENGGL
ncbi:hypothetical protein POM88_054782 [Heracleum sosnowskyi]|uniref:Uncharacterized protein n=1 Tax=Heracleum sosnowskyi TaxID=360622 RepID=A0AAD8GMC5_9APIA|nr:hypothetical protein POM88_054782 [Heracleum sosnowskyi]